MAAVLSFFVPGLGQLLNGRPFQGLLWFAITAVGYMAMIVPGIVLHLICVIDAMRDSGRRAEQKMRRQAELMAESIARRER